MTTLSVEHSLTLTEFGDTFFRFFEDYATKLEQLAVELDTLDDRDNRDKVEQLQFHLCLFADKLLKCDWDSLLHE